jgi:hypothetical protein
MGEQRLPYAELNFMQQIHREQSVYVDVREAACEPILLHTVNAQVRKGEHLHSH